jgi:hypothetical protein
MKYLFVIYTDIEYKEHLDHFKSQEFYEEICEDKNIEVIEWGADYHTDYKDLPLKTQQMMKWCSENKEYDYLVKCDDTIFDEKWIHYSDRLDYEKLFLNEDFEHQWKWGEENFNVPIGEDARGYGFTVYDNGVWGKWEVIGQLSEHYRGINLLKLNKHDWTNFKYSHLDLKVFDVSKLKEVPFFEGKFYVVSKDLSIFIGEQEKLAKDMVNHNPVEDYMVGYLAKDFR